MNEFEPYITEEDMELMQRAYEEASSYQPQGKIGDCPLCNKYEREGGAVFEGDRSYYCRNATTKNGKSCNFVLYKNNIEKLIRREITPDEVTKLCSDGSFTAMCTKVGGEKRYEGIFHIMEKEKYIGLELTFPDRK